MLKPSLNEIQKLAKDTHIENKKYFDKLKKKTPKNLDYTMQDLHDSEFKKPIVWNVPIVAKLLGRYLHLRILREFQSIYVKNHSSLSINI